MHRDVKPSNVLLDERRSTPIWPTSASRAAHRRGPRLGAGAVAGHAAYVAPEQIRGEEVDGRADEYSLGCLLHECLAGEPPFRRGSDAATLFAQLEEQPPAPPGLEDVMRRALAKAPDGALRDCADGRRRPARARARADGAARWPLAAAARRVALIAAALAGFFSRAADGTGAPGRRRSGRLLRIDPGVEPRRRPPSRSATAAVAVAAGGGRIWVAGSPRIPA